MSFQFGLCLKHGHYEYYQHRHEVPPCPICGWGKYGGASLTREEYYRSMGLKI